MGVPRPKPNPAIIMRGAAFRPSRAIFSGCLAPLHPAPHPPPHPAPHPPPHHSCSTPLVQFLLHPPMFSLFYQETPTKLFGWLQGCRVDMAQGGMAHSRGGLYGAQTRPLFSFRKFYIFLFFLIIPEDTQPRALPSCEPYNPPGGHAIPTAAIPTGKPSSHPKTFVGKTSRNRGFSSRGRQSGSSVGRSSPRNRRGEQSGG